MKKIFIVLSFIMILSIESNAQLLSRGCLKENNDVRLTQKTNFSKEILPNAYSLKKYAPTPMSQGNLSSCTAWSSAYAGLTIVRRIEENDMNVEPFSPLNLYNRMKSMSDEDPCHAGGCYVSEALNMLQDHGCAKYKQISNTCGYASASANYEEKLFNYEEVSVTTNNIKSALTKNAPVVMVIQYYNDGWGEEKNLTNGVWNGSYSGADGYHAMCIIGYDDSVGESGAFHVMNSWGSDWGQQGFFWLQYKDLFHIDQTFMMLPNPDKNNHTNNNTDNTNNDNNNSNNDNTNNDHTDNTNNNSNDQSNNIEEQVFRLYNECSVTAYVALAQYNDDAWVNKGWYAVQPGRYTDLDIGGRGQDDIYWMAINNANELVWCDDANGTDMCYDPVDAFTIYDNASPDCPKYKKFFKESPGFEYEIYSQTLTCPTLKSRGTNSTLLSTNVLEHKHDNRDADVANYNWVKGSILFDLYSKSIIHSTTNRKGEIVYEIWYIDTDKSIQQGTFTEDRLVNLKAYKFESKENAYKWSELQY